MRIARHSKSGTYAAIKIVSKTQLVQSRRSFNDLEDDAERILRGLEREIVVMKLIDHPNIMHLYDVWETSGELFLILEYVEGGELFDHICERGRLPADEALDYFQQLIDALDYCHKLNIAHRDLKPENLLLDKDKKLKVADFGMAAWQVGNNLLETACGSPHYAAPEIIAGKPYDGKTSDVWSSGIILFALLAGKLPFDDENIARLLEKVKRNQFVIPADIDAGAQDLIRTMLEKDIHKRITITEILKHPWFTSRPRRVPHHAAPSLEEISRPLSSASNVDIDILGNLRTLWHGTSDEELIGALLSKEHTWEKIVYSLLFKYRTRFQENQDEELERARSRRRTERKKKRTKFEESKKERPRTPASIPSRPDPPTPRRAERQHGDNTAPRSIVERIATVRSPVSDAFLSPISPSLLTPSTGQSSSPFAVMSPKSPIWEALDVAPPLDVPELHDEHVQRYFHQIIEHLNVMQKRPGALSPLLSSNITPILDGTVPTIRQITQPGPLVPSKDWLAANANPNTPQENACGLGISALSSKPGKENGVGILKKTSLRKGDDRDASADKHIQIVLPPQLKRGTGQRLLSCDSYSSGSPTYSISEGSSFSVSSAPKCSWFANLFKLKPITYTLTSLDGLIVTQETCMQLLSNFGVHVNIERVEDPRVASLRCQLDDVRDPAGIMEVAKAVRFRVDMRVLNPRQAAEIEQTCLLELALEKGSLSTFRLICQRLRREWVLDTAHGYIEKPQPILRHVS